MAAAGEVNRGLACVVMSSITFVDVNVTHGDTGVRLDDLQSLLQRVTVVGIPFTKRDPHDPVAAIACRQRNLLPEFVTFVRFAFADTNGIWLVQAVKFFLVGSLLLVQSFA